jgi:hypothetical protein
MLSILCNERYELHSSQTAWFTVVITQNLNQMKAANKNRILVIKHDSHVGYLNAIAST